MSIFRSFAKDFFKPIDNMIDGRIGEQKVINKLKDEKVFSTSNKRLIWNLIVLDENNKSHQIDHLLIRENGIFCIETKTTKGKTYGNESIYKWTIYYPNGQKLRIISPLRQNEKHVEVLSKLIDYKYEIYSVVVYTNNNTSNIESDKVINLNKLQEYILSFKGNYKLNEEEMDSLYEFFLSKKEKISTSKHIQSIKKK